MGLVRIVTGFMVGIAILVAQNGQSEGRASPVASQSSQVAPATYTGTFTGKIAVMVSDGTLEQVLFEFKSPDGREYIVIDPYNSCLSPLRLLEIIHRYRARLTFQATQVSESALALESCPVSPDSPRV